MQSYEAYRLMGFLNSEPQGFLDTIYPKLSFYKKGNPGPQWLGDLAKVNYVTNLY